MESIKFKECNATYAENQSEYKTLPTFHDKENGIVVSCYKLTFKELIKLILTRKIWLGIMTFNKPLQPQLLSVNKHDIIEKNKINYDTDK